LSEPPSAKPSGKTPSSLAALFKALPVNAGFCGMIELLETEQRVAESNALIERQRRLIEGLGFKGHDITSEQIVFDSLLVSLTLHLQERYRLRSRWTAKAAEASAA
jgi:hypothetical protein